MIIETLRTATRSAHVGLDALLSTLSLTERRGYGTFLRVHHAGMTRLARAGREEDQNDFDRLLLRLGEDLRDADVPLTAGTAPIDACWSVSHRWGVSYVVHGSRLGAEMLSKRVPPGFSSSYLKMRLAMKWPEFMRHLARYADIDAPGMTSEIIDGARMAFAAFAEPAARLVESRTVV